MPDNIKYPMILRTREDYEFIINNFPKEKWEKDVHKLLFDAYEDTLVGVLEVSDKYSETMKITKKDYVRNYKKIIRKFFRIIGDTTSEYEKIIEFTDGSELRKYTGFDKYYFHMRTRIDKESKAIRIGFTIDELFAILFGFLDPNLKSTIDKLEEVNKNLEGMIEHAEKYIEECEREKNESGTENECNGTGGESSQESECNGGLVVTESNSDSNDRRDG